MSNQDEIWKKLKTPLEVNPQFGETYASVNERFLRYKASGQCVKCPMSGSIFNTPYRRTISKGMAAGLRVIYQNQVLKKQTESAPNAFADFTKLRHWGLIQQFGDSKMWFITPAGENFVTNKQSAPKYAIVRNNETVEFLGENLYYNDIVNK